MAEAVNRTRVGGLADVPGSGEVTTADHRANIAELSAAAGQRVARTIAGAVGGGLLAAAVTGVLYGWGRAYYERYLDAFGVSSAVASVPLADVLFAPFNTLLSSWIRIAASVAAFGLLGMVAVLARKGARAVADKLRRSRNKRVQKFVRSLTTPVSAHYSVQALVTCPPTLRHAE